ncbi:MAG: dual specificity protein phosphatase family protein [Candidatus Delongbacteria bacterium]|nr:dual specificity protein phosphatase family protein [Candidatus Delongbacteria bacterium]
MLQLLESKLFLGSINDVAFTNNKDWAIVHATQTMHYKIFGWNRTTNKPDKNHPNYIYYENDNICSLNWVDGEAKLFNWSGTKTFIKILDFIDRWIIDRKVLVHCDQGISRSPSVCMLYLAKRIHLISNRSYNEAKNEFFNIYLNYKPGGIGDYIEMHWDEIT